MLRLRAAGCVFAEDEAALLVAEAQPGELEGMVARREAGEPLEQILGWAQFRALRISVEPGVFVPRYRTGILVESALPLTGPGAVVVDLCCGAGAIGAALAAEVPGIEVYAADIDPAAVRSARRNLPPERVFEGDLFEPLPDALRGRVDILVVNAPYVPTAAIQTMPPEARIHEHRVALDGGPDGLAVHRRIAAEAGRWLRPGGRLIIETSDRQAPTTAAILEENGLTARIERSEELDGTAVVGQSAVRWVAAPRDAGARRRWG